MTTDVEHPFADGPGPLRSINVARVVSLPADLASDEIIGRRGVEFVSGLALARELRARAAALDLDPGSPTLLRDFEGGLSNPDATASAREAAVDVALRFGRRLGSLLLMLAEGDAANRAARPDWGDAQWAFWAHVDRVVIGGGLLGGSIGDIAVPAAQEILDCHGASRMRLVRSPWTDRIGLVGLARCAPVAAERRAVIDFGQTAVKAAVAHFSRGFLDRLSVFPTRPGVCASAIGLSEDRQEIEGEWEAIVDLIVATAREAMPSSGGVADVALSFACYLRDGRVDPIEARSCYGRLSVLDPDVAGMARREVTARLGRDVRLRLLHDGTAAALAVEPRETTVVLTFGTAIGVGFPVRRDPRIPLGPRFSLD